MKSQLSWHDVHTLERAYRSPNPPRHRWAETFNNLWQTAIAHLSATDEPHVWRTEDANGQTLWHAYDPKTDQALNDVSEAEMRIWLEERHYQRGVAA
ncbi:MAG TPA: hypothetical protein V6C88_07435 [Chroococcidiopsis sp.]